jgi:hypothetical protein
MLNDITKPWKESGLLEHLTDDQSNELAKVFEEIALYLISLKKEEPAAVFIFPALYRIFAGINKPGKFSLVVNSVNLFWDLKETLVNFKNKNGDLFASPTIDAEAEFLSEYCKNYVNDLKKRGII